MKPSAAHIFARASGRLLLLGVLACAAVACGRPAAPLLLAEAGEARARILVAADAPPSDRHAAAELARFLTETTGGTFAAETAQALPRDDDSGEALLLVGATAARWAQPDLDLCGLGTDGIVIRRVGRALLLAGGRPRGTLNAVYTLLQDHVGCRWWTPEASTLARRDTLALPSIDLRYRPPFDRMREIVTGYVWTAGDFLARNRLHEVNPWAQAHDPNRAHRISSLGHGHTFSTYCPDDFFAAHPEWFALVDGRRRRAKRERAQLCLQNRQLRPAFAENIRRKLVELDRPHPPDAIWVAQNDWRGYCRCDRCRIFDAAHGGPSASVLDFTNFVAAVLQRELPDTLFWTLAYVYTQAPPEGLKARENVGVWLATTDTDFGRSLDTPANRVFADRLAGWARICEQLYLWDYATNFSHYLLPHPNLRALPKNLRLYAASNVRGVRIQHTEYETAAGVEMLPLRGWLLAQLLWDPAGDAHALIDEFLAGYYGPAAAKPLRAYLESIHDAFAAGEVPLGMGDSPWAPWRTRRSLQQAWRHLQAAQQAAETDVHRLRVRVAKLGVIYTVLLRWDEFRLQAAQANEVWPFGDYDALYEQFQNTVEEAGITHFSIRNARGFLNVIRRRAGLQAAEPPEAVASRARDRWSDVPPTGLERDWGTLDEKNARPYPEIVPDAAAPFGVAALVPYGPGAENQRTWLSLWLWKEPLVERTGGQDLAVSVSCRAELAEGVDADTPLLRLRLRPTSQRGSLTERIVTAGEIAGPHYTSIELDGVDDLSGWRYLHIDRLAAKELAPRILVGRVLIVAEGEGEAERTGAIDYAE